MLLFKAHINNNLQNLNLENSVYINHDNMEQIIITKTKDEIIINFFDVLGNNDINIKLFTNGISHWGEINEKTLDYTNTIKFSGVGSKINMNKYEEDEKTNLYIPNMLGRNFVGLNSDEKILVSFPVLYESYTYIDPMETNSDLDTILNNFGMPHYVVNLSSHYQMLLYFGYHSCPQGKSISCFMIKTNKFCFIEGFYKCFISCDCQNHEDILEVNQKSFN